jgi:antitoxin PrlF
MITSRIACNGRTTIPREVRDALGVRQGDALAYHIEQGHVVLTHAAREAAMDPFAAFGEWETAADTRAYGRL